MRQELIDLLRGELGSDERQLLLARLASDPVLTRELEELETLFGLMRRGEEIEPSARIRATVAAAAERATRPSVWQQWRALPGLIRFRFRQSLVFRIALVSLCVHLLAMGILFQISIRGPKAAAPVVVVLLPDDTLEVRPAEPFVTHLRMRRLPHTNRLRRVELPGQQQIIRDGIETLLARQDHGSFGSVSETAYATLALLGEGACSTQATRRGHAVHAAVRRLMGQNHAAALAVLVEDWALSYEDLSDWERAEYVRAIRSLIRRVGEGEAAAEGLALARAAGFPIPGWRDLGAFDLDPEELLERSPNRLSASVVLARGQKGLDWDRVRTWVRPLFARAQAEIKARRVTALAVLTLQSPYRL